MGTEFELVLKIVLWQNINIILKKDMSSISLPKRFALTGIITGIILAVFNYIFLGVLGGILFKIVPFSYQLLSVIPCSGEGCWGVAIISSSVLFLIVVPLLFIFIGYIFDTQYYSYNSKKVFIIISIMFLVVAGSIISYLEKSSLTYSIKVDMVQSEHKSYSSLSECKKRPQPYEITGDCYGYFASLNNDILLCDEYLKDFNKNLDKNYVITECIISFAINTNNINHCNDMQYDIPKQKCLAKYYIAKGEHNDCDKIDNNLWKQECLRKTDYKETNSFIKKYSKIRGLLK